MSEHKKSYEDVIKEGREKFVEIWQKDIDPTTHPFCPPCIANKDLADIEIIPENRLNDFFRVHDKENTKGLKVSTLVDIANKLNIGISDAIKLAQEHFYTFEFFEERFIKIDIEHIIDFFKSKGDLRKLPNQEAYRYNGEHYIEPCKIDGSNKIEFLRGVWGKFIPHNHIGRSYHAIREKFFIEMFNYVMKKCE